MAYKFRKQIFGFMDLLRFKNMVPARRQKLAEGSDKPLPKSYAVNRTAKILHPGKQTAVLVEIIEETADTKTFVFSAERPFYFRAGQYITVGCRIGASFASRPYAISSSPEAALGGRFSVTIKKCGFFSGYMCDSAAVGDSFTVGEPSGEFCREPLKDAPHIVAVAGGSGITPFYSMAQSLKDGTEEGTLTILYGANRESEIIFKDALDNLSCDKVKVVYVLSEEDKEGYEHGFISADIIKKYAQGDFTLMICGPQALYKYADTEYKKLGLEARRIKKEAQCVGTRDAAPAKYKLTVHIGFEKFVVEADSRETLLVAMERAGLEVPAKCRAGGCGFCHSRLISGKFSIAGADKRRLADKKFGYIHPCCTYPDSDMEIDVPRG